MVGYDSIIPPGREGTIRPKVDLQNYHSGEFAKGVNVTCNATNMATFHLTLKGKIIPIIGFTESSIRLKNNDAAPYELKLTTDKKDLEITKVGLKADAGGGPAWQADLPLVLNSRFERAKAPDAGGKYVHVLKLWAKLDIRDQINGEIVLSTNHPDKPEIRIRSYISPQ